MAKFDESKHKRNEIGRFAKMSTGELKARQTLELSTDRQPEIAYGFADNGRKNTAHHIAHAKEMGFKNQDDYEREACRFFNSNEGELYYSDRRNRFYRYDEKKGRLVTSSNGVIHTFMAITKKKMLDKMKEDKLWKILL